MRHYTVFIGRFQPFHIGHMSVVDKALAVSDKLIMVIGGHDNPRTPRNPFTTKERIEIIKAAVPIEYQSRIMFAPVNDYAYNDQRWIGAVQGAVFSAIHSEGFISGGYKVSLIGHAKDHTSYYLNLFPTWDSIEVPQERSYSATEMRNVMYHCLNTNQSAWIDSRTYVHYLTGYRHRQAIEAYLPMLQDMAKEHKSLQEYSKQWGKGPFVTVDACVIQSGFVLLISRKDGQGAGQWALPGGFIGLNEKIEDAALRELREETKLKVPEPVLRGSITKRKIYDNPHRDERARIITNAFLIELKHGDLPAVKGSDDAKEARWWPINQVMKMRSVMYADHYDIICDLLGV